MAANGMGGLVSVTAERQIEGVGHVEARPTSYISMPSTARWERRYALVAAGSDMVTAAVASLVALVIGWERAGSTTMVFAAILPLAWALAIGLAGGYQGRFLGAGSEEYNRVALGALGLTALVGTVSWAAELSLARMFVAVAFPLAALLTLGGRKTLRNGTHAMRRRGRMRHRTVILGEGLAVSELAAHLQASSLHGYDVIGACTTATDDSWPSSDVPVMGHIDDVASVVRNHDADTVAVVPCHTLTSERLRRLAWQLEPTGANLVVAPSLMDVAGPRIAVRPVEGLPLLHVEQPRFTGVKRLIKETYDPAAAALGLLLLSPLLAVVALAIKLDSPGPVLFRQSRVGRQGEEFTIYKFRTMVVDAEARKADLAALNEGSGPLFKMKRDPRITRVGAFLRKTSLDELPQLMNVVTGSMSLVGPRPHLPEEVELFGDDFRRRLLVKPGLTGLWQVSGRSDLSFEESVRVDLRYVENWSLAMDVLILWRTLSVVVKGSGAY